MADNVHIGAPTREDGATAAPNDTTPPNDTTLPNGTSVPNDNTVFNGTTVSNGTAAARNCTCEFPKIYTDVDGKEVGKIKRILKTETLQMNDGARYSRPHVCDPNPNEWREVVPPVRPKTPPKHKCLWVVRQTQIDRNPHWSLFAAYDNDNDGTKGRIWQVNGDPDVGMFYAHRSSVPGVAIFISASFLDSILVCDALTEEWEAKVDEIANSIKPPGPPESPTNGQGRKIDFQRKTCKNWVWDVLDQLAEEGITSPAIPAKARSLQPPVKAHE
ncbi:hypothetical protein SLS64_007934 [Diaporthe eres]|uniref:Uncharacterized protein n=1 Tax=Diaporthe eres TaxID=83184 RepID=A0ABR1PFE7_DIAER